MSKLVHSNQILQGSKIASLKEGRIPDTPIETIEAYLEVLKDNKRRWAREYPVKKRIELLERTLENIATYRDEWVTADLLARNVPEGHWDEGTSYIAGPAFGARMARVYLETLRQIEKHGGNRPFAKARQDGDRVVVDSYPRTLQEKLFLPGMRAEIHLERGTRVNGLPSLQAGAYKNETHEGGVALVLGAGNVSSLTINDVLHKLFEEKEVVILKANPILEYLGPLFNAILSPFIEEGFVRIVNGGSKEGIHIANHHLVDSIHITGSDKSFEAIVYGGGEEGVKNKKLDHRVNLKRITGELGNVTPVIVVPGEWTDSDFDYQADNILSMLALLNGYACTAVRVLILPKFWDGSAKLVEKILEKMRQVQQPMNYYPGTKDTVDEALTCYQDATVVGKLDGNSQPWIFAHDLNPNDAEVAFSREFWAAFMGQTFVDGTTTEEYLANAVAFANNKLWGTLAAAIIVDTKTQKRLTDSGSFTKAIDELCYGTVGVNVYPGFSFAMATTPWGAYPGSAYTNIQSGNVFVSNPFMLSKIEKSVVYAPFKVTPKPIWFATDPKTRVARPLADFGISNKLKDFGRVMIALLKH